MTIPILADTTKDIAARYGVLVEKLGIALRGLFIIDPAGVVQHITINSLPVGRSVDEAKRVLQAVQYVAEHGEVCPAGWNPGDPTMVADPNKSMEYFRAQARGQEGGVGGWVGLGAGRAPSRPPSTPGHGRPRPPTLPGPSERPNTIARSQRAP